MKIFSNHEENSLLAKFQRFGKALILPIAILPAAGSIVFANLPIFFAIGLSAGLSRQEFPVSDKACVREFKRWRRAFSAEFWSA